MSVNATKSDQVFGNNNLCKAILDFADFDDQERCKKVSRALKLNAETAQRGRIIRELTPEQIEAFGRDRLEQAAIQNLPRANDRLSSPFFGAKKFKASFVIGFRRMDCHEQIYAAVRVKYLAPGRGCFRRFSQKVHVGAEIVILRENLLPRQAQKFTPAEWPWGVSLTMCDCKDLQRCLDRAINSHSGVEIYENDKLSSGIAVLNNLLEGKADRRKPVPFENERNCCLSACFRRCFFKTDGQPTLQIKRDE